MKSRVLTTTDPADVDISAFIKPVPVDENKLAEEIRHMLNPYIRWEKADVLMEGGIAVCRLVSGMERYNKEKVQFVAGSGMFNRSIEKAVIGLAVGESTAVQVNDGDVTVTLLEATNKMIPTLDDTIAKKLGIEGVATAAQLRKYLAAKQKEETVSELAYEPCDQLKQIIISRSEFVIAEEDWQLIVDERLRFLSMLAELEGFDIKTAQPEQFEGRIPVGSYYEIVAVEQKDAWNTLFSCLLGKKYAEADGYAPTDADYETMIKDYCRTWNMSEADAKRINSKTLFDISEYAGHAFECFYRIVKEQMLKEE